ncbi:MAG: hypothetical protein ACFB12_19500 [Leptolyngbyaceae cyanobacterium]
MIIFHPPADDVLPTFTAIRLMGVAVILTSVLIGQQATLFNE